MYQLYIAKHCHPQDFSRRIAATTSGTAGSLVALNDNTGKAVTAADTSWGSNIQLTGAATPSGFYVARTVERLPGYLDMVGVWSVALALSNMPTDAICMAFTTTLDLSTGPSIPFSDPTLTWLPLSLGSGAPSLSCVECFDVLNDKSVAQWVGIMVYGSFTATARNVFGGISLRQVTNERANFQPSK